MAASAIVPTPVPMTSATFGPDTAISRPTRRARTATPIRPGTKMRPAHVELRPRAVARRLRRLRELRDDPRRPEETEAHEDGRQVREAHLRHEQRRQVEDRRRLAPLREQGAGAARKRCGIGYHLVGMHSIAQFYAADTGVAPARVDGTARRRARDERHPAPGFLPIEARHVTPGGFIGPGRKQIWLREIRELVQGEEWTPFTRAAAVSDLTNALADSGEEPNAFINADVSLYLGRLPRDESIGLDVADHVSGDGVSVASCDLHDEAGRIGSSTVGAVASSMAMNV